MSVARRPGAVLERNDLGGQVLYRPRVPTLAIHDVWPRATEQYVILWATPTEIYALDGTSLIKSTNGGSTWTTRGSVATGFGSRGAFLKLATGTLLAVIDASPQRIERSTDDGATWTAVHDWRANTIPLTPSAWCEDGSGNVYYGEYTAGSNADLNVYRSTDDGASFAVFYTFPGPDTADASRIRHVHACVLDPVSGDVYVSVGDSEAKSGFYRVVGATLEPVVTNDMWSGYPTERVYAVEIMFFPDYLVWVSDGGSTAPDPGFNLYRMARDQIGEASPVIEQGYDLGGAGWAALRAADDGSEWICTTAPEEGKGVDTACHIFAVRENGASVYELGCIPAENEYASLVCVGSPLNNSGAIVWIRGRLIVPTQFIKAELLRSTVQLLKPQRAIDQYGIDSVHRATTTGIHGITRNDATRIVALGNGNLGGSGEYSVALGWNAAKATTSGSYLVAIGSQALTAATTAQRCVAVGALAAASAVSSADIVAVGNQACRNATGNSNVGVGTGALFGITNGVGNVAIGSAAGHYLSDGATANTGSYYGTYLGNQTKASTAARTAEIVIGYNAIGGGSNTARIGSSLVTHWLPGATNVCHLGNTTHGFKALYLHDGTDEWAVTVDASGTLVTTKV